MKCFELSFSSFLLEKGDLSVFMLWKVLCLVLCLWEETVAHVSLLWGATVCLISTNFFSILKFAYLGPGEHRNGLLALNEFHSGDEMLTMDKAFLSA